MVRGIDLFRRAGEPSRAASYRVEPQAEPCPESGEKPPDQRPAIEELYGRMKRFVLHIVETYHTDSRIELDGCRELCEAALESLTRSEELLLSTIGGEEPFDLAEHLVNVCVLAAKIGMGLNFGREELIRLTVAALLHDIGMAKVPPAIIHKEGGLRKAAV